MAVIRVYVLVFMISLHKNVPVLSKILERTPTDSISTSFPEEVFERIDQFESQLRDKFTDLSKQINNLMGQRDRSQSEAMIELTQEIANLKTAVRDITSRQENFENEVKRMLQNNTFAVTLKLNNVERNLQNISSNTLQLNSSVNHLSDKIDNIWRSCSCCLHSNISSTPATSCTPPSVNVTAVNSTNPLPNDTSICNTDEILQCSMPLAALVNLTGSASDPATQTFFCSIYTTLKTCLEGLDSCTNLTSGAYIHPYLTRYCENEQTGNGCDAQVFDCMMPLHIFSAESLSNLPQISDFVKACRLMTDFGTCVSGIPEACQQEPVISDFVVKSQQNHVCNNLPTTPEPETECSFTEYRNTKAIFVPNIAISGSSTYNMSDCTGRCDGDCEAALYFTYSDSISRSCVLVDKGTVAALTHSEESTYYHRDCFASTLGECNIETHTRCRTDGRCISYDDICNGVQDCSDGSDEESCDAKSILLRYSTDGIVMLQLNGKSTFICDDGSFTSQTANVICITAGFKSGGPEPIFHGESNVRPQSWIKSLQCDGSEKSVFDCQFTTSTVNDGCESSNPIAVVCKYVR